MEKDTIMDSMDFKVSELLKEVQLQHSLPFTNVVDETVKAIKAAIDKIPEGFKVTADLAQNFVEDIGADKVEFNFKKPQSIEIGGSYAIECIAKPDVNIDIFVRLPKECFHEKDYLNYRYHAKRCLYLCVIHKILASNSSFKVEWKTLQNEARKPILIVYPAVKNTEVPDFVVRLIPSAHSLFSISKLNLKRNNIRAIGQGSLLQATPKYNSSILEDMFLEDLEYTRKKFLGWKELREALILLKVWARQRHSIYVHDCLSGFLISVILSFLTTQKKINRSMKPLQIFRVTLNFIATSKLWNNGLFFLPEGHKAIAKEERMHYREIFPVVICNSSANFNLAFRISASAFAQLQDESALTLKCMESCRDGGFEETFMTKIDHSAKYDCCIRLNLKGSSQVYASGFCLDDECWRTYEERVHGVLSQGFNDRVKFIRVIWRNMSSRWNVNDGFAILDREPLFIGVLLSSPEKAFRIVDIGPDTEKKEEALDFRKFWGEKAELRRFKDGRIAESVVWETKQWTRHLILKMIAEHVLLRHLSLLSEKIAITVDQLDFSLLHGSIDPISYSSSLLDAFEVLSKRLRLIPDIPLRVSSVQPLDSAFRFSSVFPPVPHQLAHEKLNFMELKKTVPSCIQPLEVMIQLEGSGNWPMDDIAIEKTKSAFLLQIGESLQKIWGMICTATEDDVDIFMSGYAFRLKILHEKGLTLLKKVDDNQAKQVSSADKKLFLQSQHSSMINGLQNRYPLYGPVVRLAKRWVSSHLFSACLVEEVVELLVAYLFLNSMPFHVPCSRITGFLRFLRTLSEYNWSFSPMVVDINHDMTEDDVKEIEGIFSSSRKSNEVNKQCTKPAMFLATAYDKISEAWTKNSPSVLDLKRLGAYARSTENTLTKLITEEQIGSSNWECLFRTPLNNYDAVVLLHRDKLPYPQRLLFPSEVDQGKQVAKGKPSKTFEPFLLPGDLRGSAEDLKNKLLVNFDPLRCYIDDVQKEFSTKFKLWHDSLGGDAIGVTWSRSSKKRGRDETAEESQDFVNVLKSVGDLGKGFVRSIHFLKAPRLS